MIKQLGVALVLIGLSSVATAQPAGLLDPRGEALAKEICAPCHAVGPIGESPHLAAPAFRRLEDRLDLDGLVERLRQGLLVSHPDMPMFRFSREDARALVAYLRSIQSPR